MYSLLPSERAIWLTPLLSATKIKGGTTHCPIVTNKLYPCHQRGSCCTPAISCISAPRPQAFAAEMPLLAGSSSPLTSAECYPAVPLAFCSSREASVLYVCINNHSCQDLNEC